MMYIQVCIMVKALSIVAITKHDCMHFFKAGWEERVHQDGRIFYIDHSEFCLLQSKCYFPIHCN